MNKKTILIAACLLAAAIYSFTISGAARFAIIKDNTPVLVTVTGNAYFYYETKYDKSDSLAGSNCDPVIYTVLYNHENNVLTTSACENAFHNKIPGSVQNTMTGINFEIREKLINHQ